MDAVIQVIRRGSIMLWSGSIATIPAGWHLCDGAVGTVDLQDQFVVGAGSSYAVDGTGGATSHSHAVTGAGHSHTMDTGAIINSGSGFAVTTGSAVISGTAGTEDSRPPYYALCYIQKT